MEGYDEMNEEKREAHKMWASKTMQELDGFTRERLIKASNNVIDARHIWGRP